jgi:hypothetical protein
MNPSQTSSRTWATSCRVSERPSCCCRSVVAFWTACWYTRRSTDCPLIEPTVVRLKIPPLPVIPLRSTTSQSMKVMVMR